MCDKPTMGFPWQVSWEKVGLHPADLVHRQCIPVSEGSCNQELGLPWLARFLLDLTFQRWKVSHHLKLSANREGATEGNFFKCWEVLVEVVSRTETSENFSLWVFSSKKLEGWNKCQSTEGKKRGKTIGAKHTAPGVGGRMVDSMCWSPERGGGDFSKFRMVLRRYTGANYVAEGEAIAYVLKR